jgi:hypothetical protein
VDLREVAVGAAGIYAPGGRAAYPSSVLMCAIPAEVAGVERIALCSPPGPDGCLHPLVLAAAALCGIEEVYAIGGAQAIFALAHGTETIAPVDVVAGPGNAWVREAKRFVYGQVGIDSLAGPSELMLVAGHDTDPEWAALDLCAQAEHGSDSPLLLVAVEEHVIEAVLEATERAAAERPSSPSPTSATPPTSPTPSPPSTCSSSRRTPRSSPSASAPPAASSPAATAPPPSATTPPAPTTCCRPAAPAASPARSGPPPSAAASRPSRSTPAPRRRWRRKSTPSPAPRAYPCTASRR